MSLNLSPQSTLILMPQSLPASGKDVALKALDNLQGLSQEYIEHRRRKGGTMETSRRSQLAALMSGLTEVGKEAIEGSSKPKAHFTDRVINNMVNVMDAEQRESIRSKVESPRRAEQPRLSVIRLTSNFKRLSFKMNAALVVERCIVSVVLWDDTWKTLWYMMLYTWACVYPFLFIEFFVVGLLGLMAEAYLDKHPLKTVSLVPQKERGCSSLLGFLVAPVVEQDDLFERQLKDQLNEEYPGFSDESSDTESNYADAETLEIVGDSSSFVDRLNLLINMRDLQNLTTNLLAVLDKLETFFTANFCFEDEKKTTSLFLELIMVAGIVGVLGPWIPWKAIFVVIGWLEVLLMHPKRKELMDRLSSDDSDGNTGESTGDVLDSVTNVFDLVVDEPIVYKTVGIFQVEQQMADPSVYAPLSFTNSCFTQSSQKRAHRKKPVGTSALSVVKPPVGWAFDGKWEVDQSEWFKELPDLTYLHDGWVYDLGREFRRKRLLRRVYKV